MAYQPVTEEDRRWASTEDSQPLFRGPCGPFFNWLDRTSSFMQEQPTARNVLLFAFILIGMFMLNMLLDDEHIAVLTSGAKFCADKADLLEKVNHRCQVRNKFALAFLSGAPWVKCASFTRGATLLEASADSNGARWYDLDDKNKVRRSHAPRMESNVEFRSQQAPFPCILNAIDRSLRPLGHSGRFLREPVPHRRRGRAAGRLLLRVVQSDLRVERRHLPARRLLLQARIAGPAAGPRTPTRPRAALIPSKPLVSPSRLAHSLSAPRKRGRKGEREGERRGWGGRRKRGRFP